MTKMRSAKAMRGAAIGGFEFPATIVVAMTYHSFCMIDDRCLALVVRTLRHFWGGPSHSRLLATPFPPTLAPHLLGQVKLEKNYLANGTCSHPHGVSPSALFN